jgi:single-strand DNA-binding protein
MTGLNRVLLTGNLTRDPESRKTPSGTHVCVLRVACSTARKTADGGWEERPNYFDVEVFGNRAETCARYLAKGRPVAIDGRLHWSEWSTKEGAKRQSVSIHAETVQFLGPPPARDPATEQSDGPEQGEEAPLVAVGAGEDGGGDAEDLPF